MRPPIPRPFMQRTRQFTSSLNDTFRRVFRRRSSRRGRSRSPEGHGRGHGRDGSPMEGNSPRIHRHPITHVPMYSQQDKQRSKRPGEGHREGQPEGQLPRYNRKTPGPGLRRVKDDDPKTRLDPYGNFSLGPQPHHVTTGHVTRPSDYGAIAGASQITVHREPLQNLDPGIPIPIPEDMEDDSSSEYTNTTQDRVSSLTDIGPEELPRSPRTRTSYWSNDSEDNTRNLLPHRDQIPRTSGHAPYDPLGPGGSDLDVNRDRDRPPRAASPVRRSDVIHRIQDRPLPPVPTAVIPTHVTSTPVISTPTPMPGQPRVNPLQLHRNSPPPGGPTYSNPLLTDSAANMSPLWFSRAMRYADYFDQNKYQFSSHDFALTDQSFRPPRQFVPPPPKEPPKPKFENRNRSPRMRFPASSSSNLDVYY